MSEGELYAAIAELWCSPRDVDPQVRCQARQLAESWPDAEGGELLRRFLDSPVSEEEYIDLFELAPRCPLYLGSHVFEEPVTCARAAVSDRNGYMLELMGIYRHFGLTPKGRELPDYLPMVVDFLALTAGSPDPLRQKAVRDYILPCLPPLRARLEELKTPYLHLLDALERALTLELGAASRV